MGLVTSLSQPGGNLTGVSILNVELGPKRLELLHAVPTATMIAVLVNPTNPNTKSLLRDLQAPARRAWAAAPCPARQQRTRL